MYLHNIPSVLWVSLVLSSYGPSVGGEFPRERGQAAGAVIPEDYLWLILNLLKVGGSQEVDVP
jgi:hypothetical protein